MQNNDIKAQNAGVSLLEGFLEGVNQGLQQGIQERQAQQEEQQRKIEEINQYKATFDNLETECKDYIDKGENAYNARNSVSARIYLNNALTDYEQYLAAKKNYEDKYYALYANTPFCYDQINFSIERLKSDVTGLENELANAAIQQNNAQQQQSTTNTQAEENINLPDYFTKAENGDSEAQCILGLCYMIGSNNLKIDDKMAMYWLKKSALQGYGEAQLQLGAFYFVKTKENKTNGNLAAYWYKKAMLNKQLDEKERNTAGAMYDGLCDDGFSASKVMGGASHLKKKTSIKKTSIKKNKLIK